jgi:hypothetical protein
MVQDRRTVDVNVLMAASAAELEVREVVRSAVRERDAVVDGEPIAGAAADADAVSDPDCVAEVPPVPAAADLASGPPVVALRSATFVERFPAPARPPRQPRTESTSRLAARRDVAQAAFPWPHGNGS